MNIHRCALVPHESIPLALPLESTIQVQRLPSTEAVCALGAQNIDDGGYSIRSSENLIDIEIERHYYRKSSRSHES